MDAMTNIRTADFGYKAAAAVDRGDGTTFIAVARGNEMDDHGKIIVDHNICAAISDDLSTYQGCRLATWSECPSDARDSIEAFIGAYVAEAEAYWATEPD